MFEIELNCSVPNIHSMLLTAALFARLILKDPTPASITLKPCYNSFSTNLEFAMGFEEKKNEWPTIERNREHNSNPFIFGETLL